MPDVSRTDPLYPRTTHRYILLIGLTLIVGLGVGLLPGALAQDAGESPAVPQLSCAPLAAYAADLRQYPERLIEGETRPELEAVNRALTACIATHGLSRNH